MNVQIPWGNRQTCTIAAISLYLVCMTASIVVGQDAKSILEATGVKGGLVVHLGCGDGKVTAAFRAGDGYLVQGLDTDLTKVEQARNYILSLGLQGAVSVEHLTRNRLPYAENIVNLMVIEDLGTVPMEEVMRVLAPLGVAYLKQGTEWKKTTKPWPANIDEWTHYLYDASGNAVAHDSVVDEPKRTQWVGGPKWDRYHCFGNSITTMVTSAGRLFYIVDQGKSASIMLPSRWFIAARDAFSGVDLWKRPIDSWLPRARHFRSGPVQLPRRLVCKGNMVYTTLGIDAPVVALDAATGKTVRTYEKTGHTKEILWSDGVLFLAKSEIPLSLQVRAEFTIKSSIVAIQAETGKELWSKETPKYFPLSLTVLGDRVCYKEAGELVCVDRKTGKDLWRTPQAQSSLGRDGKKVLGWFASTLLMHKDVVLYADGKLLVALSATDGKKLWDTPCDIGYRSSVDLFVIDDLVWVGTTYRRIGPEFTEGRDLHTGEVKKKFRRKRVGANASSCAHHRCYRSKATDKYLLWGRIGIRFDSVEKDSSIEHSWLRGTCQYGIMPANGLIYLPPHSCTCAVETKINGFFAMASGPDVPNDAAPDDSPLVKGPAYEAIQGTKPPVKNPEDWATYRHDSTRSGHTTSVVPAKLKEAWKSKIGGRLTTIVVAGGSLYVASIDEGTLYALNAEDGSIQWSRTVGGRIDSPPSVYGDLVLFGSADGYVYCLRSSDGALAWRFRASPEDRRIVSYDRLESAVSVHGAVLIDGDTVCFASGKTSMVDGGVRVFKLDPISGKLLKASRFDGIDSKTGAPSNAKNKRARGGILSADSSGIYMRHLTLSRETLMEIEGVPHLQASAGLLDDSWSHRLYWSMVSKFGSNYPNWAKAANSLPSGRILTFNNSSVYGFGRLRVKNSDYQSNRKTLEPSGGSNQHLFAMKYPLEKGKAPPKRKRKKSYLWSQHISIMGRAMVLAGEVLFVAGPKGDYRDPEAMDGKKGSAMLAVSAVDGKTLSECKLEMPPVFDGMIAANGKVYIALTDGTVVCMSGE